MQLNFDRDEFDGEVFCVADPRGGWGIALVLRQSHGGGPVAPDMPTETWGTITLFGDVRPLLRRAAAALDFAMGEPDGLKAVKAILESLPAGSLGMVSSPVPPYKEDLIPVAIKGVAMTIARAAQNQLLQGDK